MPILRDGSSDNESNEDLENESINEEGSNDESDSAADGIIVEEDEKVVGNSTINDLTSDNDDLEHIIVDFNETCNCGDHATHVVNEASLSSNDKTENKEKQRTNTTSNIISRTGLSSGAIESSRLAQEDTGEGWINVSNIVDHKLHGDIGFGAAGSKAKKNKKRAKKKKPVQVACITTDFSMQNVLMQMRLNIFSIDGLQIHSVKQWVLRCMACYQIHYDMDRLFCRNCGIDHLSRVSASIDNETGELKLHLKKNYKVDTRGTKYSLPNPGKQNRYKGEILLREDQLLSGIWRQKVVKINKDVKSVFGEDITSDLGLQINKSSAIRIGLGKNNPNSAKGRERRGKKKK